MACPPLKRSPVRAARLMPASVAVGGGDDQGAGGADDEEGDCRVQGAAGTIGAEKRLAQA
jgi:hypothetical protein